MKKLFVLFVLLCITLSGCAGAQQTFAFDKTAYAPIAENNAERFLVFENLAHVEKEMMEHGDTKDIGLIAQCTVVGKSTNRVKPAEAQDGRREHAHVLTPVRIDKIFYAGAEVPLSEGEEFLLAEPYFYITDETPVFQKIYGDDQVRAYVTDYNPVINEKQYIMFLAFYPDYATRFAEYSNYPLNEDTRVCRTFGQEYAHYEISDKQAVVGNLVKVPSNFESSWDQAMELYLHYDGPLPLSAPLTYQADIDYKPQEPLS